MSISFIKNQAVTVAWIHRQYPARRALQGLCALHFKQPVTTHGSFDEADAALGALFHVIP
jgi:hypothetical protein